ncbi:thioredoxin family protein [Flammeovirga kamogawensis]|uniref:Thioredoxin family protein n=1 Tax=Flammeovirga kamogawensis TaxID=373891 RepID=A0ABX8GV87_9BACT|nr:thioredoxin family protein [Flammeovirga kamogawensis]MBB6459672.1 galactose-1-phosphate uridylyltransferase [Flammeovirga kamogawensis]QWG07266.1 thioredoxin family protein [Flammeovirga kamogawensis]TRX69086.1 thioredoxin family protein [Flammeovirga kamogawensis]
MNKIVKVLHQSCCGVNPNIKNQLEKIAKENNVAIDVVDITDIMETMQYGTMDFPSIVIDGKVHSYRQNNTDEAVKEMLIA